MPNRKRDFSENPVTSRHSLPLCIFHFQSLLDHGKFTPLTNIKGAATEKLKFLNQIRDERLQQSHDSPYRMQSICDQIPDTLPDDLTSVGYYRKYYQRFTGNLNLLRDDAKPEASSLDHSPRKSCSGQSTGHIFPPECIFCDKIQIKTGSHKTERAEPFSSYKYKDNAWQHIETRAEKMGLVKPHRQVKNRNLFAGEAKHHPSCLKSFRTTSANYERGMRRAEGPKDTEHALLSAAHDKAVASVLELIQTRIILQNEVLQLSSLRLTYIAESKKNGYENQNYRSEKLLKRLQNNPINDHISFTETHTEKGDAISFWLVCGSNITLSNALAQAYTLGTTDKCQDVALHLRSSILQAYSETAAQVWPPTVDDMEIGNVNLLPHEVVRFLGMVIAGTEDTESTEKTKRLVLSIGQDLCRAVTEGKRKLPKHVLLCVTVRHLFRGKQLTTILHRLGHSESWFWFRVGNSHCQGPGSSLNLPYPWNSHRRWQCGIPLWVGQLE